jgi:general secretion pathway protein D
VAFVFAGLCLPTAVRAQNAPAPAATAPAQDPTPAKDDAKKPAKPVISERQARAADDAYLAGARQLAHNDPAAAQQNFAHAVQIDPSKLEYALSLAIAKEHHVTALVQQAAKARLLGHNEEADKAFAEAKALDPENLIVTQHLDPGPLAIDAPGMQTASNEISKLAGPIHLKPAAATHSFHSHGDVQSIAREIYEAFGIKTAFDASITSQSLRFDLDDVDFATASRVLLHMTHMFAVPLDEHSALIAKDTQENRDRLMPQVEETFYMPGLPAEQLTEMSNIAKNIFDLKQVAVQPSGSRIVIRGNEDAVNLVNVTFAEMLDGGAETVLQVHIFELDKTHTRNIGQTLPTSAGVFSIAAEATSLVSANESAIDQAVAAGLLNLTGSPLDQLIEKIGFLFAAGLISTSQFSNLLGTFGNGLTLAGLFLGSGTTFNLMLNSTEIRSLDDVQLRIGDNQPGTFRSGTRFPIITSTYSSGISSAASSALAGVSVNGASAASLLSQFSGTSQTIPQIQYEDLGLTLKATPQVLKSGQVHVHLELKIEALGGTSLNAIPVLNSRQLTSDITIPTGQTAMLASEVSKSEARSITGIPGLNEIPGFQGTDGNVEEDSGELLITITPRVVRMRSSLVASRRLVANVSPVEQ